jgi:hypothetical protein
MQHRTTVSFVLPGLITLAGITRPSVLPAQAQATTRPSDMTLQLGALARARAVRWAATTPRIHCAPAPLTERPGRAAELARPRVVPLEETFLDAARVKRTMARVTRPVGG